MKLSQAIWALTATAGLTMALPALAAYPLYDIPPVMLRAVAANECTLPVSFNVTDFDYFTPHPSNGNQSLYINFNYFDNSTSIHTSCHFNSTSPNVGPPGSTPRWGCDNSLVQFIWQDGLLTLIEKACPETRTNPTWEAAGSVRPELSCTTVNETTSWGPGLKCIASQGAMASNFFSLQPTPN